MFEIYYFVHFLPRDLVSVRKRCGRFSVYFQYTEYIYGLRALLTDRDYLNDYYYSGLFAFSGYRMALHTFQQQYSEQASKYVLK